MFIEKKCSAHHMWRRRVVRYTSTLTLRCLKYLYAGSAQVQILFVLVWRFDHPTVAPPGDKA